MDNLKTNSTICQCLSFIPFEKLPALEIHRLDVGMKKLLTIPLCKAFIAAQLRDWKSYDEMEEGLRADKVLRQELGIHSISGSQLSRRIGQLPTEFLQKLFLLTVAEVQKLCKGFRGVTDSIGKLNLIDSSSFTLPSNLCNWANVEKDWTGVKVHVRFAVESFGVAYPDAIVPSTGNVHDLDGARQLVVDSDATYVFDRGYIDYKQMDEWMKNKLHFVMRLTKRNKANVIETYPVESNSNIQLDARIAVGSSFRSMEHQVRLVEFVDKEGRKYRVVTTRWDLSAEEIAEIYRNRWLIELFFKWIKQHLPVTKVHCTRPQGIWNEMFLAMIAYVLSLYIRLSLQTQKTQWEILRLMKIYAERTWKQFTESLRRKPSRTSRGRQRAEGRPKEIDLASNVAIVK